MRRVLALFLITAAAVVAAPTIAGGGIDEDDLFVELVSPVEPLTIQATFVEDETCVEGEFDYLIELEGGGEVTPISATQSASDPDVFTFVLPSNTTPGFYEVSIECDNGDGDTEETGSWAFASIPVTKVVNGPAPTSAAYVIHLDCQSDDEDEAPGVELPEDFTVDLLIPFAGGLKYVYTDHGGICTVTEPQNGGATSVSITPAIVDTIPAPTAYPVTVTNTFATALQPNFTG